MSLPSACRSGVCGTCKTRKLSGALLRVDHVGEVCAQALYQAQALTARSSALRAHMRRAADEEVDHLEAFCPAGGSRLIEPNERIRCLPGEDGVDRHEGLAREEPVQDGMGQHYCADWPKCACQMAEAAAATK